MKQRNETTYPPKQASRIHVDYQTLRVRMPRVGDTVRLIQPWAENWKWHGTVDAVHTEPDTASPDQVTVFLTVSPARILEPLHRRWIDTWTDDPRESAVLSDRSVVVADHAVMRLAVNECLPAGFEWIPYRSSF